MSIQVQHICLCTLGWLLVIKQKFSYLYNEYWQTDSNDEIASLMISLCVSPKSKSLAQKIKLVNFLSKYHNECAL